MLGLLLLAVFGSVVLFSLILLGVAWRGLYEYDRLVLERGTRRLTEMFIFIERRRLLTVTLALCVVAALLGYLIFSWFMALLFVAVALVSPVLVIRRLRRRRIEAFDRQLADALVQMAAAFRAGLTLPQAAESIAQESHPPLGDEFKLLVREIKLGVTQEEALLNLAQRVSSESLGLTVMATNISRQLGANLAEMYDLIASTIRERFQVESRVRALTSMGRMQAWVIGAMPLGLGVVLYFMRPDLMEPMVTTAFGWTLILGIVVMEVLGMWMIRRIVDIEF